MHVIGEVGPSPTLPDQDVQNEAENIVVDDILESDQGPESDSDDNNADIGCQDPKDDDYYLMAYADFINRLITYKFIPVTSVKAIAAEFLSQLRRSSKSRKQSLIIRPVLRIYPEAEPQEMKG